LWDSLRGAYGGKAAEAVARAALEAPAPWFRIPHREAVPEGAEAGDTPGAWLIRGDPPKGARRMDIGAQAVTTLLDVQPGDRVLDLCAAPGNKTTQLLEAAPLIVVAADTSSSRLAALPDQWPRVRLNAADRLPFGPVFDRILVDAPCSGTGTLSRNPEIKWRIGPADVASQAVRQRRILAHALRALKPGGRLVYATCSLEKQENEEVVHAVAGARVQRTVTRLPGREPGDGFFAAVIS
jgi:16S rRNA (cytosine967-C5)-methyltransferase